MHSTCTKFWSKYIDAVCNIYNVSVYTALNIHVFNPGDRRVLEKKIDQLIAMEITRDELLESAGTGVHSTTCTL